MKITKIDVVSPDDAPIKITVNADSDESEFKTEKAQTWTGTLGEYNASIKEKLIHYKLKVETWMLSWGTYL